MVSKYFMYGTSLRRIEQLLMLTIISTPRRSRIIILIEKEVSSKTTDGNAIDVIIRACVSQSHEEQLPSFSLSLLDR